MGAAGESESPKGKPEDSVPRPGYYTRKTETRKERCPDRAAGPGALAPTLVPVPVPDVRGPGRHSATAAARPCTAEPGKSRPTRETLWGMHQRVVCANLERIRAQGAMRDEEGR